jgi:Raf kinase inhibitor-like YbhB/YbcL family protein
MKTGSSALMALSMSCVGIWAAGCATNGASREDASELIEPNTAPASLDVELPGLKGGVVQQESVFGGFGCTGENKSLAVSWSDVPDKTESFALIIHDPDAPTGVGFFHWTVFNIPKGTTSLPLGASQAGLPDGTVQGSTDFGTHNYGGPCPPPGGPHRYIVTVYALDVPKLELGPDTSGALLRFMLHKHTLALGRAIGTYERQ